MEPDPELMRQLLETFETELGDLCQDITDGLLALEKKHGRQERQPILHSMFRAAHNIKGAAKGVGIEAIVEMGHRLESVFSAFRKGELAPEHGVITLCLETIDLMQEAMRAFAKHGKAPASTDDLCSRLDRVLAGGEAVHETSVPRHEKRGMTKEVAMLRIATDRLNEIEDHAEELRAVKIVLDDELAKMRALHGRVNALSRRWLAALPALRRPEAASLPDDIRRLVADGADAMALLDSMAGDIRKGMQASHGQLGRLSATLHGDLRRLQLMPAGSLLRPMARMVRDIARNLGKEVELQITGEDISVDRAVLDRLHDPLIHLVRNAVDHGIESPDERKACNKPAAGRIAIQVRGEGNRVLISVEDDGRGIDSEIVAAAALARQLVNQEELDAMSREEVLHLIFRPGFSTRETITNLSGRGVGLDVVEDSLSALGGDFRLETATGKGTVITLRVPITLVTEHGLVVRAGGARFAIPAAFVDRVMHVPRDSVMEIEGTQAVLVGGQPVPLRSLAGVLELNAEATAGEGLAVTVVRSGWRSVAFMVDDVEGEREMVIKPLRPPLVSVRNIKGGTPSGGGGIMMVLDAADLVANALGRGAAVCAVGHLREREKKQHHVLVVDDSVTTRMLEKNILETRGLKVTVAVDGREAWELVQARAFDLVVTDIEMPGMDGFVLTERIKNSEKYSTLPVIIVSSRDREEDRLAGLRAGADAYIVKGQFETKALLDVVGQFVR